MRRRDTDTRADPAKVDRWDAVLRPAEVLTEGGEGRDTSFLIKGENSVVMKGLLHGFEGRIDLIYIDPPFDVGADIAAHISFGSSSSRSSPRSELLKVVAYGDCGRKAGSRTFR